MKEEKKLVEGEKTIARERTAADQAQLKQLQGERTQAAAKRAAEEKARREREQAERGKKNFDDLARREPQAWAEVDALISTKKPKEYDQAVELLIDLCALAEREGRRSQAEARIRELRQAHAKKPSLIERFDKKKLGK